MMLIKKERLEGINDLTFNDLKEWSPRYISCSQKGRNAS